MPRPRPPVVTLLLLAVLLTAGLPPASAAAPQSAAWTPYHLEHRIVDLAVAGDGSGVIVGQAVPGPNPVNGTPTADPAFFDLTNGLVGRTSYSPGDGPNTATTVVAASSHGELFARGSAQGDPLGQSANLWVFNGSGIPNPAWTKALPDGVTALAIADGGARVVVATADANDTRGGLYVYSRSGQLLGSDARDGGLHALAISSDGRYVVAGGVTPTKAGIRGLVALYDLHQGFAPVYTRTLGNDPTGRVLSVAMDPQGATFLAGSADGSVASFRNGGATTSPPQILDLGSTGVRTLAVNATGATAVAGDDAGVTLLTRDGSGAIAPAWSHATSGPVAQVSLGEAGEVVAAAVGGDHGAVLAFARENATPMWSLPGAAQRAVLTTDATALVVARGSTLQTYRLERAFAVGFPTSDGSLGSKSFIANITAFHTSTRRVHLQNDGSLPLTLGLTLRYVGDWNVRAARDVVHLLPGEETTVAVNATPGSVPAGLHNLTLVVRDRGSDLEHEATLAFHVLPSQGLLLTPLGSTTNRTLSQGDTQRALFHLTNLGNQPTNLSLRVSQDPDLGGLWSATLESHPDSLGPGASTTLALDVHVPSGVPDGARNTVTLTVASGAASTSSTLRYVVNPVDQLAASVDAPARYVNATIPGRYNVTIANDGNVPLRARLVYQAETAGTPGWTVDVPMAPFALDRGASRTFPLTLYAPNGASPGDHVYVTLTAVPDVASTHLLPPGYANVTVGATFHVFQTPPKDQNAVPGPGAAGALAGLAAALLVLRRRVAP